MRLQDIDPLSENFFSFDYRSVIQSASILAKQLFIVRCISLQTNLTAILQHLYENGFPTDLFISINDFSKSFLMMKRVPVSTFTGDIYAIALILNLDIIEFLFDYVPIKPIRFSSGETYPILMLRLNRTKYFNKFIARCPDLVDYPDSNGLYLDYYALLYPKYDIFTKVFKPDRYVTLEDKQMLYNVASNNFVKCLLSEIFIKEVKSKEEFLSFFNTFPHYFSNGIDIEFTKNINFGMPRLKFFLMHRCFPFVFQCIQLGERSESLTNPYFLDSLMEARNFELIKAIGDITDVDYTEYLVAAANAQDFPLFWTLYPFKKSRINFNINISAIIYADFNYPENIDFSEFIMNDVFYEGLLNMAVYADSLNLLKFIHSHGVNVVQVLDSGVESGLMILSRYNVPDTVEWLIEMGCDVNRSIDSNTAFSSASYACKLVIIKYCNSYKLLRDIFRIESAEQREALELIYTERFPDLEDRAWGNCTHLMLTENVKIVELLRNTDLTALNMDNSNALQYAIKNEQSVEKILALLEVGFRATEYIGIPLVDMAIRFWNSDLDTRQKATTSFLMSIRPIYRLDILIHQLQVMTPGMRDLPSELINFIRQKI